MIAATALKMATVCSRKEHNGQHIQARGAHTSAAAGQPHAVIQHWAGDLLRLPMTLSARKTWRHKGASGKLQCHSPGMPAAMLAMGCMGITPAHQAVTA